MNVVEIAASASAAETDDGYRLASIQPTAAPSGSAGRDWLVYRIAQGANVITGYRRGELRAVTVEVERIVSGLNERRIVKRGRVDLKPKSAATRGRPARTAAGGNDDAADVAIEAPLEP